MYVYVFLCGLSLCGVEFFALSTGLAALQMTWTVWTMIADMQIFYQVPCTPWRPLQAPPQTSVMPMHLYILAANSVFVKGWIILSNNPGHLTRRQNKQEQCDFLYIRIFAVYPLTFHCVPFTYCFYLSRKIFILCFIYSILYVIVYLFIYILIDLHIYLFIDVFSYSFMKDIMVLKFI